MLRALALVVAFVAGVAGAVVVGFCYIVGATGKQVD